MNHQTPFSDLPESRHRCAVPVSAMHLRHPSPYARISTTIINRINFPRITAGKTTRNASLKAKARAPISEFDCEEVHQTVAAVLIARGVAPTDRLSYGEKGDWRAIFSAVRALLGIEKGAKHHRELIAAESLPDDTFRAEPLPAFIGHPREIRELHAVYRQRLARRYRYAYRLARAAFAADTTRTRASTFRKVANTLRAHIRATFRTTAAPLFEGLSDDARFVRDSRLRKYLRTGEKILTSEAERECATRRGTGARFWSDWLEFVQTGHIPVSLFTSTPDFPTQTRADLESRERADEHFRRAEAMKAEAARIRARRAERTAATA